MRTLATLLVLAAGAAAAPASAEKVDLSADALSKVATHVVVGTVRAVYTKTSDEGPWRYARHVAEVAIESVEKGEGLAPKGLVYVRYWTREWRQREAMPPSTTGHRGLPKEGERLRVYLARNAYDGFSRDNSDGGFNVIGANGFERLADAAHR
jgi:hypothetical protein